VKRHGADPFFGVVMLCGFVSLLQSVSLDFIGLKPISFFAKPSACVAEALFVRSFLLQVGEEHFKKAFFVVAVSADMCNLASSSSWSSAESRFVLKPSACWRVEERSVGWMSSLAEFFGCSFRVEKVPEFMWSLAVFDHPVASCSLGTFH